MMINLKKTKTPLTESLLIKTFLITISITFVSVFIISPLIIVFVEAFSKGYKIYIQSIIEPNALEAIKLTLLVAFIPGR